MTEAYIAPFVLAFALVFQLSVLAILLLGDRAGTGPKVWGVVALLAAGASGALIAWIGTHD
jgi:hypothetical protein